MIIKRNRFIPFGNFKAINIFGIMFVKKNARIDDTTIRHEKIHTEQIKEVTMLVTLPMILIGLLVSWWLAIPLWIGSYYILYGLEFLIKLFWYRVFKDAYRNIGHEREAHFHQSEIDYLEYRNGLQWMKYIFRKP